LPLEQLQAMDLALDGSIAVGKAQSRFHCRFVSFYALRKPAKFENAGVVGLREPVVQFRPVRS
jgi:hypothetical protein